MTGWTASPIWGGETCFILCGGPSLAGFGFERLKGRKIIAVNSSVFSAPFADVLFFGDLRWWSWHHKRLPEFKGLVVTTAPVNTVSIRRMEKIRPPPAITDDRKALTTGHTSLTGAINLAVHFGCRKLVLLGADMTAAPDGRTHHHDPHPVPSRVGCWDLQMDELRQTVAPLRQRSVEVINTSIGSRIDWWPKLGIDEVLNDRLEHASL